MYCLVREGIVIRRALKEFPPEQEGDMVLFLHKSRLGEAPPPYCERCRGIGYVPGYVPVAESVESAVSLLALTVEYATFCPWMAAMTDMERRKLLAYMAELAGVQIPTVTLELDVPCVCSKKEAA